jgi:hypothetical protein
LKTAATCQQDNFMAFVAMNTDDDHCDDNDNDGDSGSMDHDTEVVVAIEFRVVAEYMNRIQNT